MMRTEPSSILLLVTGGTFQGSTNFALTVVGCFDESAGEAHTHFHRATSAMPTTIAIATGRNSHAGIRDAVGPAPTCLAGLFRAFFFLLLNGSAITSDQNVETQPHPPESSISFQSGCPRS